MTAIIGYIDEIPVMPQNIQEWRETIEYATSITLATLTGYLLAILLRNILHQQTLGARTAERHCDPYRRDGRTECRPSGTAPPRRADRQHDDDHQSRSAPPLGSAVGMVYTGVRVFVAM